jgi:hypothetical protein
MPTQQPRQFGARCRKLGNLSSSRNAWWAREDGNLRLKKVKELPISSAFTLSPIAVAFECRQ